MVRFGVSFVLALAALLPSAGSAQQPSVINADERVVLYPADGRWGGDGWRIRLHGWVFEPEPDSKWRAGLVSGLGRGLGLTRQERRSPVFVGRAALFVADNERNKHVGIRLGTDSSVDIAPGTGADGRFEAVFALTERAIAAHSVRESGPALDQCTIVRAIGARGEVHDVARVFLLATRGLSVVCDIDDTVRISEIGDARATAIRALAAAYEPVPGMAALCRGLEARGAAFHYISASPWQLWGEISAFLDREGFPAGSARLRKVRFKDDLGATLLEDSRPYKAAAIAEVLNDFPGRTFICIGDSSEHDGELYAAAMRARPEQVAFILIRVPAGDDAGRARAERALEDLPRDRWAIVDEPGERELAAMLEAVEVVRDAGAVEDAGAEPDAPNQPGPNQP